MELGPSDTDDALEVLAVAPEIDEGMFRVSDELPMGKLRINVAHAPVRALTGSFPPPPTPPPLPLLLSPLLCPPGVWRDGPWTFSFSLNMSVLTGEDSS